MRNIPPREELRPTPVGQIIRLIHHGVAAPDRKLELMIDLMQIADKRFSLDFMLVGESGYLERLKRRAEANQRIRFLAPVPMQKIPEFINQYDLGIYLLPPDSFNNHYALPNKIFEFIQARLGVVIGPSPEMAQLVRKYDCGVVSADFTEQKMGAVLNQLTREEVARLKQNAHLASAELNAEHEMIVLRDALMAILNGRSA